MIHKKLILLVDDIPRAALLSNDMLKMLGYFAFHATHMAAATTWMEQYSCDAIIADLLLEGDKGEQLLRWMRKNNRREPILMMSEDTDDALKNHLFDLGAHALLSKPLEPEPLRRALDSALGSASSGMNQHAAHRESNQGAIELTLQTKE